MLDVLVNSNELKAALRLAGKAAGKSARKTIMRDVLLAVQGEDVRLSCTDLELFLTVRIQSRKTYSDGTMAVPIVSLNHFTASAPRAEARLTELDGNILNAESGQFRAEIYCEEPEDFPKPPEEEAENTDVFKGASLADALDKTCHTTGKATRSFNLNGICLQTVDGCLEFVSSDADTLCKSGVRNPSFRLDRPVLISRKSGMLLKDLAEKAGIKDVSLGCSGSFLTARSGEMSLHARLLDGSFPNWRAHVPKGGGETLTVYREGFLHDLMNVRRFVSKENRTVFLDFEMETVRMFTEDVQKGSAKTFQPVAKKVKASRTFGVDPVSLETSLNTVRGKTVMFLWFGPESPVVLRSDSDPDYLSIISTVPPASSDQTPKDTHNG